MQTLSSGEALSRVTDFGFGSVLPLRSGEPKADGTGDRKTVRCPTLGVYSLEVYTLEVYYLDLYSSGRSPCQGSSASHLGQFGSPSPHQSASLPHVCIGNSLSQPLGTSLPHVYLIPCLNPWATPLPLLHFRARPLATTNSGLPHSISGCVPSPSPPTDRSLPLYIHPHHLSGISGSSPTEHSTF